MSADVDLVLLGNLLVDDIVFHGGRTLMGEPGGAILHAALGARLWGANVGLVSVVGNDYPATSLDALAERGVDVAGVKRLGRPGGRLWLLHERSVRRVIQHLDGPTHDELSPTLADIPDAYRAATYFHLAPMPIQRQQQLAIGMAGDGFGRSSESKPFVSLDPYELVRDDNLAQWSEVLEHVDAFFPSEDEMRVGGDAETAVRAIAGPRLRLVAIKRGVRGGQMLDLRAELVHTWTARARQTVDTTGAGDAFVGGFLAGLMASGDIRRGIEQGIVAASFAIEDWGARGLLAATPEQARSRWQEWFGSQTSV